MRTMNPEKMVLSVLVLGVGAALALVGPAEAANEKCGVAMNFNFDPATAVQDGTLVTITEEITVSTVGSGNQNCGLAVGDYVDDGNAQIQAVTLAGVARTCADLGESYCTAGTVGASCSTNADCDLIGGDGVCTEVGTTSLVHENNTDGYLEYLFDTTGKGGNVFGFTAQYSGTNVFKNAAHLCTDLTVLTDEECSGALITIDRVAGPGVPTAPGGPYYWTYRVVVQACEYLYGVSAQGGTNGWAQLVNRSESSLDPSKGSAVIRNPNKKSDVILWTIGDMSPGDQETLDVYLSGSLKGAPDCDERFLSGPWSALFSTDGLVFEKSDYTGRVSIFTNSNGNPDDCF